MNEDNSELRKEIGKRVRLYRIKLGLTQEKLAELSGLHNTYIGQTERGEKNITLCSLLKLTEALDTPLSTFMTELEGAVDENEKTTLSLIYELVLGLDKHQQERAYMLLKAAFLEDTDMII